METDQQTPVIANRMLKWATQKEETPRKVPVGQRSLDYQEENETGEEKEREIQMKGAGGKREERRDGANLKRLKATCEDGSKGENSYFNTMGIQKR